MEKIRQARYSRLSGAFGASFGASGASDPHATLTRPARSTTRTSADSQRCCGLAAAVGFGRSAADDTASGRAGASGA
jgi:hypothetical protein